MDRREENGSGLDSNGQQGEDELRTQRRRRTGGANAVTPVSGVPAQRSGEGDSASAAKSGEKAGEKASDKSGDKGDKGGEKAADRANDKAADRANDKASDKVSDRVNDVTPPNRPTSGVPARGPRSGDPLPPSPLHEALRGSRSTELPRVESTRELPRPPRSAVQSAGFDPFEEQETQVTGALRDETSLVDASALRASIKQTDGLYRSTKPAFAVLYGLLAALGEILMARPFLAGIFKLSAGVALAPLLAIVAFPFLAVGLYGLSTGAATAVQFQGPRVWLRTPLVYIPIALLLLIAAGAAA